MSERCIGLDLRGEKILTASTRLESGRLVVERLDEVTSTEALISSLAEGVPVRLSVPNHQTMVKTVRLSESGSISLQDRLQFELAQSLLEDADAFQFDQVSSGVPERHLGFIWRKESLNELTQRLGLSGESETRPVSYRARSIALGRGFLAVCDGRDDNLIVLADLAGESASLCYLYNRHIVDVAVMPLGGYDLNADFGRRGFGVDLRTLMNYRQSTLLDAGISVPLAGLYLTGETVDDAMLVAVKESFPVAVSIPRPHEGFFGSLDDHTRATLPLYLTAVGLTVN